MNKVQRKLTTILAADAEGYSRAMETDEVGALVALRAARKVFTRFINRHEGRVVNTAGDGLIAEFPSVVEAVQCAIEVQQELSSFSSKGALRFRIGIHLGDVMVDGDDLLGEGVNLAARLESMAETGGILISRQVYDQVQHKLSVGFEYLGEKRPKNFAENVSVYRLSHSKRQSNTVQAKPRPEPTRPASALIAEAEDFRERLLRHTRLLSILWLLLLAIDIFTGSPFWAHWPGLAMVTFLALKATPLYIRGWFSIQYARMVVILIALTLVNLFTWSGYPWIIWPAIVVLAIALIRRFGLQ